MSPKKQTNLRSTCRIPVELIKEFEGDLILVGGEGHPGGIALEEKLLADRELLSKLTKNFGILLIPKEFVRR